MPGPSNPPRFTSRGVLRFTLSSAHSRFVLFGPRLTRRSVSSPPLVLSLPFLLLRKPSHAPPHPSSRLRLPCSPVSLGRGADPSSSALEARLHRCQGRARQAAPRQPERANRRPGPRRDRRAAHRLPAETRRRFLLAGGRRHRPRRRGRNSSPRRRTAPSAWFASCPAIAHAPVSYDGNFRVRLVRLSSEHRPRFRPLPVRLPRWNSSGCRTSGPCSSRGNSAR